MSATPGGPRRRRIAGERRPRTPATEPTTEPVPAAEAPVDLGKSRRPARKPADERPAPVTTPVTIPGAASRTGASTVGATSTPADDPVDHPVDHPVDEQRDAQDAPVEQDDHAAAHRTSRWGSRLSLAVLGALLAVLLLLTGLLALGVLGTDGVADVQETQAVEEARRTAPATAEAAAAAILAYDHKSLDADQDNAVGFMTDEFAEEYSSTFEKVVRPAAEQNRAKVTATVLASSVIRATEDSARVLIFVDQATVSRANPRPQIALNRVVMTMERTGDTWLVSDISSY